MVGTATNYNGKADKFNRDNIYSSTGIHQLDNFVWTERQNFPSIEILKMHLVLPKRKPFPLTGMQKPECMTTFSQSDCL